MSQCPYGDPACPCQDGDACHYVALPGSPAMTPPHPPAEGTPATSYTVVQELLDQLGWSREFAAIRYRCSESAMRTWASGRNTRGNRSQPPPRVVEWLRSVLNAVDAVPVD